MIRFENVSKTYDGRKYVLNDLNIEIGDGEFVFIMGPSGAGKTTFTKLLLREEKLSEGRIYFDKYKIHKLPDRKVPYLRRKMGFVFQDFRLFQNKTVYENVAFAMEVLGEPNKLIKKRVPVALDIVGLTGKEKVMPKELSGGEKQRLCVARAIVNNPSIVVADEPTGNLDFKLAREIMDLLVKIAEYGKTVIVVTHANDLVAQYDKRVITIENGCVVNDTKQNSADSQLDERETTKIINTAVEQTESGTSVENSPTESTSEFTEKSEENNSEVAKEMFPDEQSMQEGNNLFNSIMNSLSGDNNEETVVSDSGEQQDSEDFSVESGTKYDDNTSKQMGEKSFEELSALQRELSEKRIEIQNEITSILAGGDESMENKIDSLRNELDKLSAEIDTLDNEMGRFGEVNFDDIVPGNKANGGDRK